MQYTHELSSNHRNRSQVEVMTPKSQATPSTSSGPEHRLSQHCIMQCKTACIYKCRLQANCSKPSATLAMHINCYAAVTAATDVAALTSCCTDHMFEHCSDTPTAWRSPTGTVVAAAAALLLLCISHATANYITLSDNSVTLMPSAEFHKH